MALFEFVQWLAEWLFQLEDPKFDWDDGNRLKSSAKHNVETRESEEVFRNKDHLFALGQQIRPKKKEDRFGILGQTNEKRILMISFTIRGGRIRIISARPISTKEKKLYEAIH